MGARTRRFGKVSAALNAGPGSGWSSSHQGIAHMVPSSVWEEPAAAMWFPREGLHRAVLPMDCRGGRQGFWEFYGSTEVPA